MGSWLVGKTELTDVLANHIELYFNICEFFASVHTDHGSDHFRENDGVSEMSLDWSGLLTRLEVLLGLSELLDESLVFVLKTSAESSLDSGTEELDELLVLEGREFFEGETSEGVFLCGTFLSLSCCCCIYIFSSDIFLLEGGSVRTLGSTDTWLTVSSWLVGKTELTNVLADHIELNFNICEFLASVHTDD